MLKEKLHQIASAVRRRVAAGSDYEGRLKKELENFNECHSVHELPMIFHYWSNKYLRPKLERFGISDPEHFFFVYAAKYHARHPHKPMRLVSIGSGNCDMECRLARRLLDSGIDAFTIECIDINAEMLARGMALANSMQLSAHIHAATGDFNSWRPPHQYEIILANQVLHHVVKLEQLFGKIKQAMAPEGYFLVSDMIGRNGHQRWPEALAVVNEFWRELPDAYKRNRLMSRTETTYINHDCSVSGFEGVRAQDILPLLVKTFQFELFIPFANVILTFIDRTFGHNFDASAAWDQNFIDRVHDRDEAGIMSGELKPTQMLAVLTNESVDTQLLDPRLTPAFCIRDPEKP